MPIADAINYANAISTKLKFPTTCKKTRKRLADFIGPRFEAMLEAEATDPISDEELFE